jgi:hypothetical protein
MQNLDSEERLFIFGWWRVCLLGHRIVFLTEAFEDIT